jgi:phosphatidylglycerophosphate synthase
MSTLSEPSSAPVRALAGSLVPSAALRRAGTGGPPAAVPGRLAAGAALTLATGFVLLVALGVGIVSVSDFGWRFLPPALVVYGTIAAFAYAGLDHHPHERFGAPNVVTTLRAVATALFAGLVLDAGQIAGGPREIWAWTFAAIALAALLLDGVDGYLARRLNLQSSFGARYDMEVDALLILLLSILAFSLGKAGAFVLAIGLMRYAFLSAQFAWPWLAGELPPSMRRKAVCVLQAAVLGAIITPVVEPPFSNVAALLTVTVLAWSFIVDILWLFRNRTAARG